REETGAMARICVDPYNNSRKKRLQLKWEGYRVDYDVKMKAKYMALSFIYYNCAHPPGPGTLTCSAGGNRPPPCTSDEYAVDPDERNICVLHGPMVTTDKWTGKPPPDGYAGPRPNNAIIGPRRKYGNQI
ncbi:MAG: hypothetical protein VX828_00360, partial [Candidatus Thermoplasmatota archaeon]|nr:hypothetical protein [Candidatus Thermoplasmatota archaeon]